MTQIEEGGWWEGTSHESGKTGWFPSNYAKEAEPQELPPAADFTAAQHEHQRVAVTEDLHTNQAVYRQQLISELVEKELDFIQELRTLSADYLQPLSQTPDM